MYAKMGLQVTQNILYVPVKAFAQKAKELHFLTGIQTISTICYSYLLDKTFPIKKILKNSIKLNSKIGLSRLAKKYQFSIPKTILSSKETLVEDVKKNFDFSHRSCFVKSDGLGGGNHVFLISNEKELHDTVRKLVHKQKVVIQDDVSSSNIETISTYLIKKKGIEYINTRAKMVYEKTWYGNIFEPGITLGYAQKQNLHSVAQAVQKEGFATDQGVLVGFDAFLSKKGIYITEINARWLGSTPAEQVLKRLGLLGKKAAVSSFDYIHDDDMEAYKKFVASHLYSPKNSHDMKYQIIPLGLSAYKETNKTRILNHIIVGDFEQFTKDLKKKFSKDSFILTNNSLVAFYKVQKFIQ